MAVRALLVLLALGTCALPGCDRSPPGVGEARAKAAKPVDIEPATYDPNGLEPLSDPDLIRDVAPRAQEILEDHARDPIGTEIPFVHAGRRFVARIEMHDNPYGGPKKPWGPHRGVTVYRAPR